MLCFNVTAGIAVLGVAKTMLTEIFGSALPDIVDGGFAATYVLMTSVFNMAGRFFWASASDYLGRRRTYAIFFGLGAVLYLSIPWTAERMSVTPAVTWLVEFYARDDADLHDVRRRLRHDSGLPGRPVRHPLRGRHPRPAVDGLEHGRRAGAVGDHVAAPAGRGPGDPATCGQRFAAGLRGPVRRTAGRVAAVGAKRRPSRSPSCWRWRRRERPIRPARCTTRRCT